jgi:ABC-type glutathione transport system ATPase component
MVLDPGSAGGSARGLVDDALAAVGLAEAGRAYFWQLSGGMQQRVSIARAVAHEPEVLLMDEPFAAADAQTRADLEDLVRRLWRERGMTILFVAHDIDEAAHLGQRVLALSGSPTVVQEQLVIDLPEERDQLRTRSIRAFAELRTHAYERIQAARRGTAAGPVSGRRVSWRGSRISGSPSPPSSRTLPPICSTDHPSKEIDGASESGRWERGRIAHRLHPRVIRESL